MGAPRAFEFRRTYLQACKLYDAARARGIATQEWLLEQGIREFSVHQILIDHIAHSNSITNNRTGANISTSQPTLLSLLLARCGWGSLEVIPVSDTEVYVSFMNSVTPSQQRRQQQQQPDWLQYALHQQHEQSPANDQATGVIGTGELLLPDPRSQGMVCEYLQLAQLALVLGDTVFLHGGLRSPVLGALPESAMDLETSGIYPPDSNLDASEGLGGVSGTQESHGLKVRSRCRPFVEGGLTYRMVSDITGDPWVPLQSTDPICLLTWLLHCSRVSSKALTLFSWLLLRMVLVRQIFIRMT